MNEESLRRLYDREHARAYDERFLLAEGWARDGTEFELELIAELLARAEAPRWLDVACGTGLYLSRFPDIERAGLDLSPAMLEIASDRNAGVELIRGSFLDPRPEWLAAWSLVSCMWAAYSYVSSLDELSRLLANLASWTAPGGCLFLPVCDFVDLTGGMQVPFRNDDTWVFGGPLMIKAAIWEWQDEQLDKRHLDLIAPHIEYLIELLGRHFNAIEVVDYPPYLPGWGSRRAIVGTEPRADGEDGPATLRHRPAPPSRNAAPAGGQSQGERPAARMSSRRGRLRRLALRFVRGIERRLAGGNGPG